MTRDFADRSADGRAFYFFANEALMAAGAPRRDHKMRLPRLFRWRRKIISVFYLTFLKNKFDKFVNIEYVYSTGVTLMRKNNKMTTMLYAFSLGYVAIGAVLTIVSLFLGRFSDQNIGLMTGFGFLLGGGLLGIMTGMLSTIFVYERHAKETEKMAEENLEWVEGLK